MFFLSLAFDILVQPVVECNQWGSAGMPGAVPEGFLKREALIFSLFNSYENIKKVLDNPGFLWLYKDYRGGICPERTSIPGTARGLPPCWRQSQ